MSPAYSSPNSSDSFVNLFGFTNRGFGCHFASDVAGTIHFLDKLLDDFGQKMCNEMRIANAIVKMDFMSPGNEFTESNTPKKKDGGGGLDAVTNREKKPSIGMILFLFR
jgi:hypothetical protein|tara:strand:- start:4614 stop:4940 length:327 start_codon:yes stop_codon:yes gene_type:complete